MKLFLTTLGCRLNEAEISRWSREFREAGHQIVPSPESADAIVLNSCAVTSGASKTSRQTARRLHREAPTASLVMTGCFASLEGTDPSAVQGVDLVVANEHKDELVSRVLASVEVSDMPSLATEPDANPVFAERRTRGFVGVQDGCRNRCTFCIVTVARGQERSRTLEQVLDDIKAFEDAGVQEVVLTGVHLGGYGSDLGLNLRDLLETVLSKTAVARVRMGSLEPWELPEGFFDLWSDPRLCPHLHLPLQSGSDRILKRMARRNTAAEFQDIAEQAYATIPGFQLTTDLIVGFPGETEEDFAQTLAVTESVGFGHVHAFRYSPRQGTAAARMSGQVRGDVMRARSAELHALAARLKADRLSREVGSCHEVLLEGRGTAVGNGRVRWLGYTPNYFRVEVDAPAEIDLQGHILRADVVGVLEDVRLIGRLSG